MNFRQLTVLGLFILTGFTFFYTSIPTENFTKSLKKKAGPDLFPSEWAWMQRAYPNFKVDPKAHLDAVEQAKTLRRETNNSYLMKKISQVNWEFAGPVNIGGRIVDIEFNPVDPTIVYSAAATGGVFKSTDTGNTWFPVFDEQNVLPAGDIAVDPLNPDIVYVGTGEPNGSHNNLPGGGVFKSTNAGATWQNVGLELSAHIGRIIIDPTNNQRIFVAAVGSNFAPTSQRGLFRSTNAGQTWENVLFITDSTGAIDVVMDPTNPNFMLAAMWERSRRAGYGQSETSFGPSSGIYKSTDGGDSWNKLGPTNGLPNDNSGVGRIGLAISQSSPSISYAVYTDGGVYTGLYKTTDYGNNWVMVDNDFEIGSGTSSFSWYFGQVRIHPTNPDFIIVLDVSFMRSTNGGNSWPIIYGYGGPSELHVDHHALAFNPANPNYLISGNDGGINISTDGGVNWSDPKQIPATQFYEIGLDALNPQRLYGGTQDNNTIRTTTGAIDDWEAIWGGDGFYVIVDYTNSNYIYAESQYGYLARSTNGGQSFFNATNGINGNEPTNWSTPVIMDPNNNSVLYYGTNRLYRTTNKAQNWNAISGVLTANNPQLPRYGTLTTIAVAKTNSDVIYIGTDDSKVWVTPDLGNSWFDISAGLPNRWVTRIMVDPKNEANVYVTFSGLKWRDQLSYVFRSTDMGTNWIDISSNLPESPVNAIALDNNNSDVIYVGSDVGAFVSFNNGTSWEALGSGLPVISVYDMKIHPTNNYLAIGTHGRSMYKLDLNQIVSVDENESAIAENYKLYQNYPNPFNPGTSIQFELNKAGLTNLSVYDIKGELVKTLREGYLQEGNYKEYFDASSANLASGIYFFNLSVNDESGNRIFNSTQKGVLLK